MSIDKIMDHFYPPEDQCPDCKGKMEKKYVCPNCDILMNKYRPTSFTTYPMGKKFYEETKS